VTIARRMAIAYAWLSAACIALVAWLWYHEFVEEPREFAARGLTHVHEDTEAEFSTVCFLAAVPLMLGVGWWWIRRVLSPLGALATAVEHIDTHNLQQPFPRSGNGDEVDTLAAGFNTMTARLDASFRRIHEFTLHASHELKTPLTVMRAHLEMAMIENPAMPREQCEWIEEQLDEVKRLTRIVDSLTLLTKADAGLIQLEHEPVPLAELVSEAFDDAGVLAHPQSVQVTLGQCDAITVSGDRHRLRQLLLILTDNAVKYNRPGGTIDFSLRRSGATAELRVANTSAPIDPKTLEHIFERFVRGDNARGKVQGCGLGLTIALWIVQAHGGTIEVRPGSGDSTVAIVRLPAADGR